MKLRRLRLDEILTIAREAARDYVTEHGKPLDPAATDWDGEQWQSHRRHFGLGEIEDPEGWALYQKMVAVESRLVYFTIQFNRRGLPELVTTTGGVETGREEFASVAEAQDEIKARRRELGPDTVTY